MPPSTDFTYACATRAAGAPVLGSLFRATSVSCTQPGATALMRRPRGRSSAAARTKPSRPALTRLMAALHRMAAQKPTGQRERAPVSERLDAEADQVDLAHELVGEREGKVLIGESEQRTERGSPRGTDHRIHRADVRVESLDRLRIRHIDPNGRARMTGRR